MDVSLDIKLHLNQRTIFDSDGRIKVVMAGKRFGKSELAVFLTTKAAGSLPGGTFWYIAPYFSQAESIAWQRFKDLIPGQYIRHKQEHKLTIELINGAKIILKGADNQNSLRGPKIDGVILDEAAYMDKYIWNNILRGQLLGTHGDKPGFAFFISSPINPSKVIGKNFKDWYPDFYDEALRKSHSGNSDWKAFHFTIYDNPYLSKDDIDEIRADSTDDEWNVEYLAKPSAFAGQVYSEFDYAKHVMEYVPDSTSVFIRGVDWGISHPTVCLFAYVDDKGKKIYFEDEYVKSDYTIQESCEVIKKKTGDRKVDWTICDPSLHKRNSVTLIPDIQEFSKNGVPCIAGDNNNRGYNILKMFFKRDMIRINPKCRILIKQLKELQWTDKVNDDCPDCARYISVRVHDLIFKWKDLTPQVDEKARTPYVFNFNDAMWNGNKFPDESKIRQEVRAY